MLVTLTLFGTPVSQADAPQMVPVASGLDNPRGLAFGPEGALYVTEAGRGTTDPNPDPATCFDGPEGPVCYGATGAVTRILNGQQERIASGLPSLANPAEHGDFAIGPQDIAFRGRGNAQVVVGLGANPAVRDADSRLAGLGQLVQLPASGAWRNVADMAAYEADANPDGGEEDSNPYGVLNMAGARLVVDAGANALLRVRANGNISTLAVFPDRLVDAPPFLGLPPGTQIPMQSVPTSVVMGPDGAYYVGELTGFPFPLDGARIYRVVPGQAPQIYAEGFTNVIDIAFGQDGSLYVLEFATNSLLSGDPTGALIRINPDGTRDIVASAGLVFPAGVAVGPDGGLYVSNYGAFAGAGQVVRIEP
jgi:hypothetical protein